jgi:hypothetical protein
MFYLSSLHVCHPFKASAAEEHFHGLAMEQWRFYGAGYEA